MMYIKDASGKVISHSQNLAGVRKYIGMVTAEEISISQLPNFGGLLKIKFTNWATFETNFASFTVLKLFISNLRNAHGTRLLVNGLDAGPVSRNNTNLK